LRERWRETDDCGTGRHQRDGERECRFSTGFVGVSADQEPAERSKEIAYRKRSRGHAQLENGAQCREEHLAQEDGKKCIGSEIEKLECVAERGYRDHFRARQ